MIERYSPADFRTLWSDEKRFQTWFDVELAACEAMETQGWVPQGTADAIRPVRDRINPSRIEAIEAETRHDVIAFLTHIEELAGKPARFLHRGMTSSDVLDTSLAILLSEACERLILRSECLLESIKGKANSTRNSPMMGRSHGIHAQPLTFGVVMAGHYAEIKRAHQRLVDAKSDISYGKLSGAIGTYGQLSPEFESQALSKLDLQPETLATQVVPRDRHAVLVTAAALYAAAIERLATNIRHWQRTEVSEAEEAFSSKQKGSSAMPHKKNPIWSENLCGLARIVRAAVVPALENIPLWHERDISHSSVERMILPDVTSTLAFMLERSKALVENLVIKTERQQHWVESSNGLWASEGLLLSLVDKGIARQEAYRWVQRNALSRPHQFQQAIIEDPDISNHLSREEIVKQFDLHFVLRYADTLMDRAFNDAG